MAASLRLFVPLHFGSKQERAKKQAKLQNGMTAWRVTLTDITFVREGPAGGPSPLSSLVVHFPLAMEDPIAAEGYRRACLLMGQLGEMGAAETPSLEASHPAVAIHPLDTVHELRFETDFLGLRARGGEFFVLSARERRARHAVLALKEGGVEVGQAVMCLEKEAEGGHWKSPVMELDVTNGGRLVGRLSLRVKTLTKKATERDLAKGNAWGSKSCELVAQESKADLGC